MIKKENLEKTSAWPFVEAKKLLRERKSIIEKKKGKDPNVAILNHESAVRRNACCRFKRFSWSKLDKKNNVPKIIVTIEAPKKDESILE